MNPSYVKELYYIRTQIGWIQIWECGCWDYVKKDLIESRKCIKYCNNTYEVIYR